MPRTGNVPVTDRAAQARAFWAKVEKTVGCWIWRGARGARGYGRVHLRAMRRAPLLAHRFAWIVTFGEIPAGQLVLHKCDNPCCVRPDHLFLGTQRDNLRDMDRKNRRVSVSLSNRRRDSHGRLVRQ